MGYLLNLQTQTRNFTKHHRDPAQHVALVIEINMGIISNGGFEILEDFIKS